MIDGQMSGLAFAKDAKIDAMAGVTAVFSDQHAFLDFEFEYRAFSSAVLNGGATWARHFANLKVAKEVKEPLEQPSVSIQSCANSTGREGTVVGMMTAASMQSLRWACIECRGIEYAVLLTSGLDNARRVGDSVDVDTHASEHPTPGTINIAVVVNAELSDAALMEIFMLVTEAKVAALAECGVLSPVSSKLATGTGTDSLAVFSSNRGLSVSYAGKHTLLGASIGNFVVEVLSD